MLQVKFFSYQSIMGLAVHVQKKSCSVPLNAFENNFTVNGNLIYLNSLFSWEIFQTYLLSLRREKRRDKASSVWKFWTEEQLLRPQPQEPASEVAQVSPECLFRVLVQVPEVSGYSAGSREPWTWSVPGGFSLRVP